jgi:PAS domain S-box-containing protein
MTLPLKFRSSIPLRITLAVPSLVLLGVWGLTFYASHLSQHGLHAALGEHQDALVLVRQRIVLAAAVVTPGLSALVWWVVRRQLSPLLSTLGQHNSALEQLRIAATAFESLEGKTITNAEQVILKVNAAFTRITGYSAEEVVGQTLRMLSSGRQSPSFYQAMWHTLAQDGFWRGEIWNRRKSGEIHPEWLVIRAVKNETGSPPTM